MDDDDDDDDDDGVRKQIDGAFPLSLLRLPTHRPSILSNSRRRRRRRRHRISVVLNGAEDFFQRVVVFRVFSTSIISLFVALFSFARDEIFLIFFFFSPLFSNFFCLL